MAESLPWTLRPCRDEDFEFVFQVGKAAMGDYVVQTFGKPWVDDEHRRMLADSFDARAHQIVVCDGIDIGVVSHEVASTHVQLSKVYLMPAHQRQGLGTALVQHFQNLARSLQRPLRLRVLRPNPARRLYERLGFVVTGEAPERIFMEWRPA